MDAIRPRALRPGDTIGIVSPSWFGGETFVPRAERGIRTIESLGLRVKVAPHAFNNAGHVSDTARNRADELHAMFADPSIAGIFCTIGGDHSNQLLPLLDWDLIRRNPKVFLGASDTTVLNVAIWSRTGLVTFNGPSLLTEWAEFPGMPALSVDSATRLLALAEPFGPLRAVNEWTDEFLHWETGQDTTRRRHHLPGEGWRWIEAGKASGTLVGGCLESLEHVHGAPWWPELDGAILFIETSEDCAGPEAADSMLMDYGNIGVFDQIAGLLVARPYGMNAKNRERFLAIVEERTAKFAFPVVADMDFGHTSPQRTIPVGVAARIDGERRSVEVMEPAVRDAKSAHDIHR